MNTGEIKEQLADAWYCHQNGQSEIAFERLHNAVGMLTQQCELEHSSNVTAANVASCLANGINPD